MTVSLNGFLSPDLPVSFNCSPSIFYFTYICLSQRQTYLRNLDGIERKKTGKERAIRQSDLGRSPGRGRNTVLLEGHWSDRRLITEVLLACFEQKREKTSSLVHPEHLLNLNCERCIKDLPHLPCITQDISKMSQTVLWFAEMPKSANKNQRSQYELNISQMI